MPRIICIDADVSRAEEPVEVLRSAGYEVMLAFSPEVGMALVRLFPPDLVLLDLHLADQLASKLNQACPSALVVLTGEKPVSVEEVQRLASHQRAVAQDARPLSH